MSKPNARWQKIGCYALLILFAAYLAYAGARWVDGTIAWVFPSSLSLDGTKFISLQIDRQSPSRSVRFARIRDAEDGSIIADLSHFDWRNPYMMRWSPDGTLVAGIARTYAGDPDGWDRVIVVRVHPNVELLAEYDCHDWYGFQFDDQNRLATQHTRMGRIEFRTVGKVNTAFEVGLQENARYRNTVGNIAQVVVSPRPVGVDNAGNPIGEFLYTDGKQDAMLWIDRRDGSVAHQLQGNFECISGTLQYVHERFKEWICHRDAPSKPIIKLSPNERLLFAIGHELLCEERQSEAEAPPPPARPKSTFSSYDLKTGKRRLLDSGNFHSPTAYKPHRRPILADGERKYARLNIADGTVTPLIDLTVSPVWQWSVMLGLPLLWALWMAVGVRFGSRYPFLDMIALSVLTVLVTMGWSMLYLREYRPDLGITSVTMVSVAAAALFCLTWASSTKTFWGTLLPTCVGSVAVIILFIRIWSYNSSFRIVEGLVGCTVGLGSQLFGLWMLRRFAGRISRKANGDSEVSARGEAQMTLRQGLTLMVAFGVLFAAVRDVNVGEFIHSGTKMFLIWMALFTTKMVVAGIAAIDSAFRRKNTFVSCLVAISVSAVYSVSTYAVTRNWDVFLLISPVQRCVLPVIVGALVWIGLRYCRYHGYRFAS